MPSPANLPLNFNRDRTERQLNARLEELLEKLRSNRPSDDPWLVRRAYDIAAERHRDQFRLSGDPYITHLLEVAHILADMRLDATTLAAALLHDVIEDTEFPLSRLQERFGEEVARLVEGVTKIGRLNMMAPEARQAENVRKMLLAMVHDVRVVLMKLADRVHNMRTLEYLDHPRQVRIARETMDIYSPIAHRLGMSIVKGRTRRSFLPLSRTGILFFAAEGSHGQGARTQEISRRRAEYDSHQTGGERHTRRTRSPGKGNLFAEPQNQPPGTQPRSDLRFVGGSRSYR